MFFNRLLSGGNLNVEMVMPGLYPILAWTALLGPAADEPVIAGRRLSEWQALIPRMELRDPESRRHVPGLIAVMDDPNVPWMTRRQAALTLGRLGPLAHEAIGAVAKHLDEVDCTDPEISPQRWALSALALYGREAKEVTPQLIRLLRNDSSSRVARLGCLEALSQIGSAAPEAISALWKQLELSLEADANDAEGELAAEAAQALGMVGPDAAAAVPVLMRAAQADDDDLRREAVRALGRIGISARDAQPLLCDLMLSDDSEWVREAAMLALGQTGPAAWPLVEPLLTVKDAEIRERAVTLLADWRSAAKSILPGLEPLLADQHSRVRLAAAKSWRALAGGHDRVWPILTELLTDADRPVRRGASQELQAIVQGGRVTESELQRLERDDRPAVRNEAIRLRRLQARTSLRRSSGGLAR